ncbi:MAG: hypothetical protein L0Y72_24085 [Gemmataceae bacterium]|nr:hypothetical protein [Gemmataceae bacterium]MCI0742126.1 hypothetical protein [Gemmataceae bacterium]
MRDHITFGLAYAGYLLLCINLVLHAARRPRRWLLWTMAVTISTHVFLVWHWRFGWSLEFAWGKSPAGFLVFHSALAVLIAATLARQPWSGRLLLLGIPIVSAGALGVAFRYEYVAHYRWLLVTTLLFTAAACVWLRVAARSGIDARQSERES